MIVLMIMLRVFVGCKLRELLTLSLGDIQLLRREFHLHTRV